VGATGWSYSPGHVMMLRRDPSNQPTRSNSQPIPDDSPTSSTEQGSGQKKQDGATPVPPLPSIHRPDIDAPDQEAPTRTFRKKKCMKRDERKRRHVWTKAEQIILMECYYDSNPTVFGYVKRLHDHWIMKNMENYSQQHLADQARSIIRRKVLSEIELEEIHRRVTTKSAEEVLCPPRGEEDEEKEPLHWAHKKK